MRPLHALDPLVKNAGQQARHAVRFKIFRGGLMRSWDELCEEAAAFASALPPESLISISHSDSHSYGIITVWYWSG